MHIITNVNELIWFKYGYRREMQKKKKKKRKEKKTLKTNAVERKKNRIIKIMKATTPRILKNNVEFYIGIEANLQNLV